MVTDPFASKFCSPVQNNIGSNFIVGLNFVTCEHFFTEDHRLYRRSNSKKLTTESLKLNY